MKNNLTWIQEWRKRSHIEHPDKLPVISIESLTNLGWVVSGDFRDFSIDARNHTFKEWDRNDFDWLKVKFEGPTVKIYCGPELVNDALGQIRDLILEHLEGK
jgi:Immunity protein 53